MHMQAAQTQASGEGSTDLVSYVEFQKHQRLLSRSHKAALIATRSFWRLLMGKEVGGSRGWRREADGRRLSGREG